MAGKGERFARENYLLPKPVLPVNGLPMAAKAALDLPLSSEYLFVVLRSHIEQYNIQETIKASIPQAEFIIIDQVTEGQACTCLLAMDNVDNKTDIMIGACDNGLIFDRAHFAHLQKESDVIVFTFRHNAAVIAKPMQYGWVKVNEDGTVSHVSVKKPISDDPFNDHAIVGAFWFKSKEIYRRSVENMILENRRINNEFYIDECINDAVKLGFKTRVFEVSRYICWGTPDDYKTYNYWKAFFLPEL